MKITRIEVHGFGALRDVTIDLSPQAPTVLLYGPNEAGKSTLMQFIRAVLFGFAQRNQPDRYEPLHGGVHGGALVLCDAQGRRIRIERFDAPGAAGRRLSRGALAVRLDDGRSGGEELLRPLIGDLTGEVYKNIFAFGLAELQEIRTLQAEEINPYLFSSGFGISGSLVLDAGKQLQAELDERFKPRGKKQTINQLAEELAEIDAKLRQLRGEAAEYGAKQKRLAALAEDIRKLNMKLQEARDQQAWLEICLQSQEPWMQLRAAETELAELGGLMEQIGPENLGGPAGKESQVEIERSIGGAFPEDGLQRFEEEKSRLEELRSLHAQLSEGMEQIAAELSGIQPQEERLARRREAEELAKQAAMIEALEAELKQAGEEKLRLEEQVRVQLSQIDANWTEADVQRLKPSLYDRTTILEFRDTLAAMERQAEAAEQDAAKLEEEGQHLALRRRELAGEIGPMLEKIQHHPASRLLELAPELRRRQLQSLRSALDNWRRAEWEREAEARRRAVAERFMKRTQGMVHAFLGLLLAVAAVLFFTDNPLAGAVITGAALVLYAAYALSMRAQKRERKRSEAEARRSSERHGGEVRRMLEGLLEAKQAYAAYAAAARERGDEGWTIALAEEIIAGIERDLEGLQASELEMQRHRERMQELERQIAEVQTRREAADKRLEVCRRRLAEQERKWQAWLAERELPRSLKPETAGELYNLIDRVRQTISHRDSAAMRIQGYKERIAAYEQRVRALCEALAVPYDSYADAAAAARGAAELTAQEAELWERRQALQQQYEQRAEEAQHLEARIRQTEARIRALWDEVGAKDEEDYQRLAALSKRRRQLAETIREARLRLEWLVTPERYPLLRQTLEQTGGAQLAAEREELSKRIAAWEQQTAELRDERAKLELELTKLSEGEAHAEAVQLREEKIAELHKQAKEYLTLLMAQGLLKRTQELYEREKQPKVLRIASRYMAMITGGRYVRILAPFGEQRFLLERHDGVQLDTARLSRGTAEQLYLAMRFALLDAYHAEYPLPVVLDDIFVNFDAERAARCLDVVREVSRRRQVLIFTCHDHMRRLIAGTLPETQIIDLARWQGA